MNRWQRLLAVGLVAAGVLAPSAAAVAAPKTPGGPAAPALSGIHICYSAWFRDGNWSQYVCDGAVAADPSGQSQQIDEVAIYTSGVGGICAWAETADGTLEGNQCELRDNKIMRIGIVGSSLGMRSLGIAVQGSNHVVCANGYLSTDGWQGYACAYSPLTAETGGWPGQVLEAIALTVQ